MSLSSLRREAKKAYSDLALISHTDVRYPYRCLGRYTAFSVCLAVLLVSQHVSFESWTWLSTMGTGVAAIYRIQSLRVRFPVACHERNVGLVS